VIPEDATVAQARSLAYLFRGQAVHCALLLLLVPVAWAAASPAFEAAPSGRWLGIVDRSWFRLSIVVAVTHQILVWLVFRGQLGWGVVTRLFGRGDLTAWGAVFLPLLVARPLLVAGIALADRNSLILPQWFANTLGVVLLLPAGYTVWSVIRFFGVPRAIGGDHFRTRYRRMGLVREGAFAWTPNAMYALVFLGLWSIALIARSHAALVSALFQHAYIWVHYHCTERPDMELIYGR
jgi:hypothetical protein